MTVSNSRLHPRGEYLPRQFRRLTHVALWLVIFALLSSWLPALSTPAAAQGTTIRINAGGGAYTDPSGKTWSADTGFSGGGTYATSAPINNTSTGPLYQTERYGAFSYNLAVPNGTYQVTLKFAEVWFTLAGQRVFNVAIEGQTVLANFDILKQVAFNTALDRSFTATVNDGSLTIAFSSVINNPKVSAIEIVPASPTTIRINAGGGAYTDPSGKTWSADTGFSGGGTYATSAPINNTSTGPLYQTERFGAFSYNLAVPNGTYQVTLKFAEVWFTLAGQRVFNVAIEGQTVLANFDILKQVAFNTALDRSFTATVNDGSLTIAFSSVVNNPKVSAIEVVASGTTPPPPTPTPTPTPAPSTTRASYWGAFVPGAPWDMAAQDRFETMAGKKASIMPVTVFWQQNGVYYSFMGNSTQYFPTTTMEAIRQRGSIPMLVWGAGDNCCGVNQPNFRSAVVANGTHDTYVRGFARQAKAWGKPFFLKLNWEMNGDWRFPWAEKWGANGNQPGDFARAWRHVRDVFTQEGVTNATWVWCPNVSDGQAAPFSQVFPGEAYVDWTCLHGYNWGPRWNLWQSFTELFNWNTSYQQVVNLAPSKPMMLGEWASNEAGDGGAKKASWIRDAFDTQIPNNFPQIRAWVWYHVNDGAVPFNLDSTTAARDAFRASMVSSYYKANLYANFWTSPIPAPTK